jgi:CheY-like chemotaxis protein
MSGKPKVLLIDDSEMVVMVTREVLQRDGFEVRTASSLGEFNVILKTWSPTVVLTDVNMPGVTGAELCRWIKVRVDTQSVPVVLFSDLPDPVLAELARTSGADGFVSKANGLDRLGEQLTAICEEIVW